MSTSTYRTADEWVRYYREKGVDVVQRALVKCPRCVAAGEDGRPVYTQGVKGLVGYHECPRCKLEDGETRYRFVSVEVFLAAV